MDYSFFTLSFTVCIVVENLYSSWSEVIGSVPQESVLEPMRFVLFIDNNKITVNGVLTKLYAGDLKLYTSLISTDHNLYKMCYLIYV